MNAWRTGAASEPPGADTKGFPDVRFLLGDCRRPKERRHFLCLRQMSLIESLHQITSLYPAPLPIQERTARTPGMPRQPEGRHGMVPLRRRTEMVEAASPSPAQTPRWPWPSPVLCRAWSSTGTFWSLAQLHPEVPFRAWRSSATRARSIRDRAVSMTSRSMPDAVSSTVSAKVLKFSTPSGAMVPCSARCPRKASINWVR